MWCPGEGRLPPLCLGGLHHTLAQEHHTRTAIALRWVARVLGKTVVATGHQIRGHIHPPIFPPFALDDVQRGLLPINLREFALCDLRDAQATAQQHQKQGAVHRMDDLRKEPLPLVPGERFRQGAPASYTVTGLHGLAIQARKETIQAMRARAGFGDDDFIARNEVDVTRTVHMVVWLKFSAISMLLKFHRLVVYYTDGCDLCLQPENHL
jgi:hypothetical protein